MVRYLYFVMLLITASEPLKYGNRLILCRLIHGYRLKTAFQGGILFNILAVLLDGGGAYKLKLASGQGWL